MTRGDCGANLVFALFYCVTFPQDGLSPCYRNGKQLRICLITPSFYSDNPDEALAMPLGIGYLGAVLERDGFEVTLIDGAASGTTTHAADGKYLVGASPSEIASLVVAAKPDLIGISCPFTTRYRLFQECIKAIRECLPDIPIIAGGIHPTLFYQRVLLNDQCDAVVLGEGEETLLELSRRFADGRGIDPEGLDGVAWRQNGIVHAVPRQNYIEELDTLPQPARHLLPMDVYLSRSGGRWASNRTSVLLVLTSRSCPGRCSFCSVHAITGPKWRAHSAKRVVDEITAIKSQYSPSLIAFEDDRLTWDRERLYSICQMMIERNIKTQWYTPNGVHVADLDEELLQIMKKSGCRSLNLAIESGDPTILHSVIGKRATAEQAIELSRACKRVGIRTNGYFVIGMPGESDATVQRSLDLCLKMGLDGLGLFIATPFPGTRMFEQCVKSGYIDPERFTEEFLESGDPNMLHQPLFETETMSRERLLWWEREFNRQFMTGLYRRRPAIRVRAFMRGILSRMR